MCKCGKANQPTRKYCIRCGALLIDIEESKQDVKPSPVIEEKPVKHSQTSPVATNVPTPTTGDKWVRPSQVDRERMRTAERHVDKTEFEKAKEAFSKDVSSEGDDRMLRASEIKELMDEPYEEPSSIVGSTDSFQKIETIETPPREIPPPMKPPTPDSLEEEMVKPIPTVDETFEIKRTEKPTPSTTVEPPTFTPTKPRIEETLEPRPEIVKSEAAIKIVDESLPPKPERLSDDMASDDDSIIRELKADIVHYEQQMQQLEAELDALKLDHEGERKWLRTVAETKRIRVETMEEDLKKAKDEYSEADKELQSAENRMKKEVKESEKRIDAQKKRIKDAEKNLEKRQKEIEKSN